MAKIMLPTGRIIERVILVSRVEQIRFKGRKIIVQRVYNLLFDAIVPGFGRNFDFWKCNEGKSIRQMLRDEYQSGYNDGYEAGAEDEIYQNA